MICGSVDGVDGPVCDIVTDPEYLDVTVPPGAVFTRATPRGHTMFAYVYRRQGPFCDRKDPYSYQAEGENYFDMERWPSSTTGIWCFSTTATQSQSRPKTDPVRFLLISGKPIGEPIAWYGPIVMNTQEELRVAFDELQRGTFIKAGRQPG